MPKAKYEYANMQRKTLFEDAKAMILLIFSCYVIHTVKY